MRDIDFMDDEKEYERKLNGEGVKIEKEEEEIDE